MRLNPRPWLSTVLLVVAILSHHCGARSILRLDSTTQAPAHAVERAASTTAAQLHDTASDPNSNSSDPPFWLIIVIPAVLIFILLLILWCLCSGLCRWGPRTNANGQSNVAVPGVHFATPAGERDAYASLPEISPKCPYPLLPASSARETRSVELEREGYSACSICMSYHLSSPVVTPCNHAFCYVCIVKWLQFSHICPICRVPLRTKDLKQFRPSRVDLQAVKKDLVIPKRQSAAARTCSVPSTASQSAVVPAYKSRSEISIAPPEKLKIPMVHQASTLGIANKNQTASAAERLDKATDSFQEIPLNDDVVITMNQPARIPLTSSHNAEQRQSVALEDPPLRSLEEGTYQPNVLWSQQKSKSAAQILTSRVSDSVNQLTRTARSQLNNTNI